MEKASAYVWLPQKYLSNLMNFGTLRVANLAYFHKIENAPNGIEDINEGNQINKSNVEVIMTGLDGEETKAETPRLYQGSNANDIFIYSMTSTLDSNFTKTMLAANDERRCILIKDIESLKKRISVELRKIFPEYNAKTFSYTWSYVKYENIVPNCIYLHKDMPTPEAFTFTKSKEYIDQNEIRIAIFTKNSRYECTNNLSYECEPKEIILNVGNLSDMCEDITETVKSTYM